MRLIVQRDDSDSNGTPGNLWEVQEDKGLVLLADTLEDVVREVPGQPVEKWKIPNVTAIPVGTYPIKMTWSPRFHDRDWAQRYSGKTPEIFNVPGYEGVRAHPGSKPEDTDGCLLIGSTVTSPDEIHDFGHPAYFLLCDKLVGAESRREESTIEYRAALKGMAPDIDGEIAT